MCNWKSILILIIITNKNVYLLTFCELGMWDFGILVRLEVDPTESQGGIFFLWLIEKYIFECSYLHMHLLKGLQENLMIESPLKSCVLAQ